MAEVDSDEEDAYSMVDKTLLLFQELHGFSILDEWEQMQEIQEMFGGEDKKAMGGPAKGQGQAQDVHQKEQEWLTLRAHRAAFAERLMDAWSLMLEDSRDPEFTNAWSSISRRHQTHLDNLLKQMSAQRAREIVSACITKREGLSDTSSSSSDSSSLSLLDCRGENLTTGETLGPNAFHFMAQGSLGEEEKQLWSKARDHQREVRILQDLVAVHEQHVAEHKSAPAKKASKEHKANAVKTLNEGRRKLNSEEAALLNAASRLQRDLHLQLLNRLEGTKLGSRKISLSARFQGINDLD